MKKLIFIGGTMGVGKTTTSKALLQILKPSVWLDGDWCWQMNPWSFNDTNKKMVIENICFLLNNYIRNDNYEYIIFSWVMHKQEIIDEILNHLYLKDVEINSFSLVCSEKILEQRMISDYRDETCVLSSIQRIHLYQELETIKINTDHQQVVDVAKQIKKMIT